MKTFFLNPEEELEPVEEEAVNPFFIFVSNVLCFSTMDRTSCNAFRKSFLNSFSPSILCSIASNLLLIDETPLTSALEAAWWLNVVALKIDGEY